jgi:hypothetical protein
MHRSLQIVHRGFLDDGCSTRDSILTLSRLRHLFEGVGGGLIFWYPLQNIAVHVMRMTCKVAYPLASALRVTSTGGSRADMAPRAVLKSTGTFPCTSSGSQEVSKSARHIIIDSRWIVTKRAVL